MLQVLKFSHDSFLTQNYMPYICVTELVCQNNEDDTAFKDRILC